MKATNMSVIMKTIWKFRMVKGMLRKGKKTKKMMTRTKCKWASRTVGRENNHFAEKGEKLTGRGLV